MPLLSTAAMSLGLRSNRPSGCLCCCWWAKTTFLPKSFPACLCQICDATMSFLLVGDDCDAFIFLYPSLFLPPILYSKFFVYFFFSRTLMLIVIVRQILVSLVLPCSHKHAMQNDILLFGLKAL